MQKRRPASFYNWRLSSLRCYRPNDAVDPSARGGIRATSAMRKFGIIFGTFVVIAALLIAGGVAWYGHAYPTYTYRFRLAIAVDVGGETKTASSVIEVKTITQSSFLPQVPPIRNEVHGDAVFLDLGQGRNVIVTLAWGPNGSEDRAGFLVPTEYGIGGLENLPQLQTLRGARDLTGEYLPALITFHDLNDPTSARVVAPDQFEQVFGPDVHFERVWIEMTSDPLTGEIAQRLPWLPHPGYLSGRFACAPSEPNCLHGSSFSR